MPTIEEERQAAANDRRRKSQRVINAYHVIFSGPDGEAVLNDIVSAFGIDIPAFLPTATSPGEPIKYDPYYAAIRDGQRSVFLHIMTKLKARMEGEGNITEAPSVITE
jgi:hypothetical protein